MNEEDGTEYIKRIVGNSCILTTICIILCVHICLAEKISDPSESIDAKFHRLQLNGLESDLGGFGFMSILIYDFIFQNS